MWLHHRPEGLGQASRRAGPECQRIELAPGTYNIRIRYDLHYIRNWSLGLDVRILARTLAGAWFSQHES